MAKAKKKKSAKEGKTAKKGKSEDKARIIVSKNGPYLVSGSLPLDKQIIAIGSEGKPEKWKRGGKYPKQESYSLCRCGNSKTKPFCDSTHALIGFVGTETASRKPYRKQADVYSGPNIGLADYPELCALARFCERAGNIWRLVRSSDKKAAKIAAQEACDCPSGRLVIIDKKSGRWMEPKLAQGISLVEDPQEKVSGPIWVKGFVSVESANGRKYEKRGQCTLCRCGKSTNKPFCDGMHISIGFKDGDKSLKKK